MRSKGRHSLEPLSFLFLSILVFPMRFLGGTLTRLTRLCWALIACPGGGGGGGLLEGTVDMTNGIALNHILQILWFFIKWFFCSSGGPRAGFSPSHVDEIKKSQLQSGFVERWQISCLCLRVDQVVTGFALLSVGTPDYFLPSHVGEKAGEIKGPISLALVPFPIS